MLADCLSFAHEIVISEHILDEIRRHLGGKLKMSPAQIKAIDGLLRGRSTIVTPVHVQPGACRDADDLPVLETAIAGAVALLVTGDSDLRTLGAIGSIPIVTPRAFYDALRPS